MTQDEMEMWREQRARARAALRMIRETIEALGPPGALPPEEAVLRLHGPGLIGEAQAICSAIKLMLERELPHSSPEAGAGDRV